MTSEDRMLKFHIQEYERCTKYIMEACSRVSGHHVDQTFAIIDVTGSFFSQTKLCLIIELILTIQVSCEREIYDEGMIYKSKKPVERIK